MAPCAFEKHIFIAWPLLALFLAQMFATKLPDRGDSAEIVVDYTPASLMSTWPALTILPYIRQANLICVKLKLTKQRIALSRSLSQLHSIPRQTRTRLSLPHGSLPKEGHLKHSRTAPRNFVFSAFSEHEKYGCL